MPDAIFDVTIDSIRDLIDSMANRLGDTAFLISPETQETVTFRGLQKHALSVSRRLRRLGLERGDKVAFLMDNGLFTAELFLGTMYSGLVSVPLNVRAGITQLSYTLDHCNAKVVFAGANYRSLIEEVTAGIHRPIEVIFTDIDLVDLPDEADDPSISVDPCLAIRPDEPALLMYTSGSTGQPKGVVHTHRSVLAHGRNSTRSHELTAADRSLLVLPLYHINAECVTLIPTLMSGGSVVIPHHFTVSTFWDWLDDWKCTWSALVPTIISQLLDWKDPKADSRAACFQRIRFLRSSSAPLSPSLHREFLDKFQLPLIQAMGSSEAGNVFSNPVPPGTNKIGSPGLPWGFEARIVDRDGAEVPRGEHGEVLLRGAGMMQGYYKDPAGTAVALDAEGWLHTGDLAYRDEDGYFFIVGRAKELIIKGGMNIAPKQIDEILESHPAVLEAVAVGVPDRYVGEDVVAFTTLRAGASCDERELLSFCEGHLGHFKTPTRIYFVQDLPKGPSGKVQRLRLVEEAERRAADGSAAGLGAVAINGSVNGQSTTDLSIEPLIAGIWSDLLSQSHIDRDSNFFALGGQSLLAIQYLSRLREKIPVIFSLTDFFENATVAQQAALVRQRLASVPANEATSNGKTPDLQPIPLRDRSLPCPLSPGQERIWFMEQMKDGEPAYNEAEAVRWKGKINIDVLERAFNAVVERHEMLRATIEVRDGQPNTIVHENWPVKFNRISLRDLSLDDREVELNKLLSDEPRRPYRLENEPGVRVTIIELASEDHVFILMMHHVICDSSSLGILWREFRAFYDAFLQGHLLSLPPLPIQYGDYAAWKRGPSQEQLFSEELDFWRKTLQGAPLVSELPGDRPRLPVMSYRGVKRNFEFDAALVGDLRNLSRRYRSSLFSMFAAGLNALIYRYTGQEDILIGLPIADRERPELQGVIGFLLDTQVLRTDLSGNPTFPELLARVQRGVAEVYSHRAVPFDQVVSMLKPARNLSYPPIFQIFLNWRDRNDQPQFIGMTGIISEGVLSQPKISKFDLTITAVDWEDRIALEIEYSTDLFNNDRIERLVAHLRTLLEGALTNADLRLSELPLLTRAEQYQLLVQWNGDQALELHS